MPSDSSRPVVSVPNLAHATGFPARWIPTSTSAHVVAIVVVLLIRFAPVTVEAPHNRRLPPQIVDLQPPVEAPLLPAIESSSSSSDSPAAHDAAASAPGRDAPSSDSSMRLVFKGSQHIVSNTQDATNSVQTILQPDIQNAPRIPSPLPVPSMVKMAAMQRAPSLSAPSPSPVVQVSAPPTPAPAPQPALPKIAHVDLDTVPLTSATDLADSPKIVAYNTSGHAYQPVHPPSPPSAAKPAAPVPAANANPAPAPPPRNVKPAGGTDARNIVVVNAVELHSEIAQVPAAELHGSFEVTPDPGAAEGRSTGGSSTSVGSNGKGLATRGNGAGKGPATSTSKAGAGSGPAHGDIGAGNGRSSLAAAGHGSSASSGSGNGNGRGTSGTSRAGIGSGNGNGGNGSAPFSGMTIVGGTITGGTGAPAAIALKTDPDTQNGTYGLTIVSSGSSGGGLRDYGIFNDGPVFTVYLDVSKLGIHGTRWSLQYSAARDIRIAHAGYMLTPPFPQTQILPLLPPAIVAANVGRLFVFQAMLKPDGTFEGFHVLESPDARLNEPMLASLTKWTFQPASMGTDKVPIKVLMGIPIASVMADTGVAQQAGGHSPADSALHSNAQ